MANNNNIQNPSPSTLAFDGRPHVHNSTCRRQIRHVDKSSGNAGASCHDPLHCCSPTEADPAAAPRPPPKLTAAGDSRSKWLGSAHHEIRQRQWPRAWMRVPRRIPGSQGDRNETAHMRTNALAHSRRARLPVEVQPICFPARRFRFGGSARSHLKQGSQTDRQVPGISFPGEHSEGNVG